MSANSTQMAGDEQFNEDYTDVEDGEQIVAVVAHNDFGVELLNKDAIQLVLEAVAESPFDPDRIAYPKDAMGGGKIRQAFVTYNSQVPDDQQKPGMWIPTRWDQTDDKDPEQLGTRDDGKQYWRNAPQFRDEELAAKADALIVVEEGDWTDRIVQEFEYEDKPVYDHGVASMDVSDFDL